MARHRHRSHDARSCKCPCELRCGCVIDSRCLRTYPDLDGAEAVLASFARCRAPGQAAKRLRQRYPRLIHPLGLAEAPAALESFAWSAHRQVSDRAGRCGCVIDTSSVCTCSDWMELARCWHCSPGQRTAVLPGRVRLRCVRDTCRRYPVIPCYCDVGRKRVTWSQISSATDWMDCEPSTVAQRLGSDFAILA